MLRSCSPHVALPALRLTARGFLVISPEARGLTLRCHLQKVLEVPLVHIVLIHCSGMKEAAISVHPAKMCSLASFSSWTSEVEDRLRPGWVLLCAPTPKGRLPSCDVTLSETQIMP